MAMSWHPLGAIWAACLCSLQAKSPDVAYRTIFAVPFLFQLSPTSPERGIAVARFVISVRLATLLPSVMNLRTFADWKRARTSGAS
jgi:hypothetical protein